MNLSQLMASLRDGEGAAEGGVQVCGHLPHESTGTQQKLTAEASLYV